MFSFDSSYSALNDAQKKAVDTVEGPVMVIAGPGTGKTQVLSMRVANILKKTQARPSNILCLTFSSSGASAMRERLRSLIGPQAYGVTISTIHGFANEVITSHPIVFDAWSTLEQISDLEQYRQLNSIIDQFLPDISLVNKKSPYLRSKEILSAFSMLKREGKVDAVELKSIADQHEHILAGKSKEGTKAHEKNLLMAKKFREFVDVFLCYQKMLEDTGRYDYDDMILTTIKALKEEDWMLAELQERYQYILVDEFQDTNGAQYELIELLTTPRTQDDRPNLFVVGDDDQAIYRFQGANLTNILKFKTRFPSAEVVVLSENYRSSQSILDSASSLVAHNTERLTNHIEGLKKDLHAATSDDGKEPLLLYSPSDAMEPWLIADLIEERIQQGIPPQEIAVLTQTNSELRPLYDVLKAKNIPVEMTGKVDLLTHPLVSQAIAIFRAGMNLHADDRLANALGCACFECHPADLGRLFDAQRRQYLEKKDELQNQSDARFGATHKNCSLMTLLLQFDEPNHEDPLALHHRESLLDARTVLLKTHQLIGSESILSVFEYILKESGMIPEDPKNIDPLDHAALAEFFGWIKNRAYEYPAFSARHLQEDLDFYLNPDYGDLRLSYDLPHLTDVGVQLMTAHKSKGLEFHTVILTHFREKHWNSRTNRSGISIPEDLLFGWQKEQKDFEKGQDERRVAFVAMTRAKRELIFTCPRQLTRGGNEKAVSPSAFFAEAGTLQECEQEIKNPEEASTLLHTPVRHIDSEFASFLRHRLKDFSLSVTALNHFLQDPLLFLESDLLQTPQSKEPSLVYGNAVHDALKQWGFSVQTGKPLSKEQFLHAFLHYLTHREVLTDKERANLSALGKEALPRYFDSRLADVRPSIAKIEHPITANIGDIRIKGKLDRIDLDAPDSSNAHILDFKTGRPKTESDIRAPITEEGGGYWNQLVFYALLMKHGMPYLEPKTFSLDFIGEGSEHPVLRTFQVTQHDMDELWKVIDVVWAKIMNLDFTKV